jgi:hypothetical protein
MTKENMLEIIKKEGLFQHNIFGDHKQKANEIIIKKENDQYLVYETDGKNNINGDALTFLEEKDAIDKFLNKLRELKNLYISTYVGKNYETSFKELFDRKPHNKIYASLCWPPIIFGPCWLIYRKMYKEAIIFIIIQIVIAISLTLFTGSGDQLDEIIGRFSNIILAIIGNSLYHLKIYKTIKNINNNYMYSSDPLFYIKKYGGTNIVLAIILFLIILSLSLLPIILRI